MAKVTYIEPDGTKKEIDCQEEISVMQLAISNLVIGVDALCGGMSQCATCHVYVGEDWIDKVGAPGETEKEMLEVLAESIEIRPTSRLSCQIEVTEELDGLVVEMPKDQPGI